MRLSSFLTRALVPSCLLGLLLVSAWGQTPVQTPPGELPPYAIPSAEQPGSVLVYNYLAVDGEKHTDTTFTVLNTHPEETVSIRIFFISTNGTLSISRTGCVAPGAKLSFKASENEFQNASGYAIAVAVSAAGCPTRFNYLVGSETVEAAGGASFTLGAMAIPALYRGAIECRNNPIADVKFDGVNYAVLPRSLALDNLPAGQERAVTIVTNSLSGNIHTGSETGMRGLKLAGQVLGGGENNKNFTAEGGPHISKSTGDLVPGLADFHADQRSGWLRLWTTDDAPVFGVALTPSGAKHLVATSFTRTGVLSFVASTACVPPSSRHQADLALYATSSVRQTAVQGQNVNFKFKAFNNGPEAASVALSGSLDAKLKVVSCVESNGAPCRTTDSGDPSLNLLIFNPFSLGVGEYKEFNVTAQVASDVTAGSVLKSGWNVGFNVNPGESWSDPDTSNGGASFAVEIPANSGNHAPVAVAKSITGQIVAPDGKFVTLTLDGSASSDVDGDQLEFQWMDNGDLVSTKARQDVEFPVGSHRVVLTVSDGRGGTATATLAFNVLATPPPRNNHSADLAITPNRILRAVQFGETVTLKFTVSNNGPEVATPYIFGQFSEVMQIVSCTDSLGNVCHGGGVSADYREFPPAPLAVGATREIAITLKMPASEPSGVINRATWSLGFVANSADETWTDPDNTNNHGSMTFELPNAPANVPPVAKIILNSPNQPLTLTAGSDGLASITLFGTQSSDPDNNGIAIYEWLKNGQLVSKKPIEVFKLGVGTHSFVLRVTDYRNGVGVSEPLVVTVTDGTPPPPPAPNKPPVARALPLPATLAADSSGKATVQLNGAGSSDPDGDTLTYEWRDNGQVILTAATGSVQLSAGAHSIVLTVNDGHGGSNSTTPQIVTVAGAVNPPPTSGELSLNDVSPNSGKRGTKVAVAIDGSGFAPGSIVTVNSGGVTVVTTYVSPTKLTATFQISNNTMANARSVTVTNPNGVSATKSNAFTIKQ